MILSLRRKTLNSKIKEMNILLDFFTNVLYASSWLHGTHRNGIPFLAKLKQAYRNRWFSRSYLAEFSDYPLTLEDEERKPSVLRNTVEKSHTAIHLDH